MNLITSANSHPQSDAVFHRPSVPSRLVGLRGLLTLFLACLTPLSLAAERDTDVPSPPSLSGPVEVELENGRSHRGQPVSLRDEILVLRTGIDDGEVEQGFPLDRIARLHFPGEELLAALTEWIDTGDLARALPSLEALWRQRAPFLSLLEPETLTLLTALPDAHLAEGDPYRAIGLARNLLPHAPTDESRNRLHESILIGHHRLEFVEETEKLAHRWIARQDEFPSSALGWRILADLALREGDFERVTWLALQPIALADPKPMPHLGDCYALAIHAFHKQELPSLAAQLYDEMVERDLPWPDDPDLAETGRFYRDQSDTDAEGTAVEGEPDLDLRPPEEDLNLPIQNVRRLVR